jgi:hypothetical protein
VQDAKKHINNSGNKLEFIVCGSFNIVADAIKTGFREYVFMLFGGFRFMFNNSGKGDSRINIDNGLNKNAHKQQIRLLTLNISKLINKYSLKMIKLINHLK